MREQSELERGGVGPTRTTRVLNISPRFVQITVRVKRLPVKVTVGLPNSDRCACRVDSGLLRRQASGGMTRRVGEVEDAGREWGAITTIMGPLFVNGVTGGWREGKRQDDRGVNY